MQFVCVFFHLCRKFDFLISQGSVATCLKWGGYRVDFVANFIRFPAVQKFWTSVNIWQSYMQLNGGNFFETQCSSGRQPNFAALNRGRHLYSAGRPSRWALSHISSSFYIAPFHVPFHYFNYTVIYIMWLSVLLYQSSRKFVTIQRQGQFWLQNINKLLLILNTIINLYCYKTLHPVL